MKTQALIFLQCLVCALTLAACGGGGGNDGQAPERYTVSTNVGVGGDISPTSALVDSGNVAAFTVTPEANFSINSISGCGGNLSGSIYTTGAITADCTVTASFVDNGVASYNVTAVAGAGGAINPDNATVVAGDSTSFAVMPDAGFVISSVAGCNGSLSGSTYTTGVVNTDCTVTATFVDTSMASYTVTSTAGVGGSVSPASVVVNEGGSTGFSILANAGFVIDSVSGCNGSLVGDTYTTGAVTANCSVAATFVALTPPVANAGSDQTVDENTPVTLNGSATDSDGSIVSYSWSQLSGPAVLINNSLNAIASFDAPEVTANQDIVFQLTVTDDDGLTASAIVTITIENIVDNSVAVVAATGMPAAGFPDGFIYWSVSFPSIGDSGHIAFGGAADTSIGSTSQNTNALWAGLPDNLSVIVKENDTLPGLPSNVLVDGVIYGSSTKPPIVTKSGYVSHLVGLKGAVAAQNNTAIVAHINDVLYTVVREGDQGQGLPPGYIYDQIIDHAFSDTGLVFSSLVTNSGLIQGTGLWFWDLNELHLLGFSEITANTVSIPEESPNLFGGDCEFNGFNNLQINNAEEIGFVASFKAASGRTCNANSSLLKWKQNVFEDIFSHQQPVDGLDDYVFNLLLPQFMSYALQDNGDIGIVSRINQMNLSDPRDYYWVYKNSGDKEYLAITGELLPGSTLETIAFGLAGTIATAPTSSNDGAYLVSTSPQPTVNSPLKPYLLKGSPLPLPYSTVSEIGASQLSRLVKAGDVPPNFPSTTFFSSISLILGQSPTINSQGDIIFTATRADAANPANNIYGIWRIDPAGNISPLLEQMDKVFFNGAEVNQVGLLPIIHGAGSGRYKRHSDTGQVIVQGELENAFQAIILLSP